MRRVTAIDWEGVGALHALLLELDARAAEGAAVVGPDGIEVAARAVEDKLAVEAIVRSAPQQSQYGLG